MFLEKIAIRIRHSPALCKLNWLWNLSRPIYELILKLFLRRGRLTIINGIDKIYVCHECRNLHFIPEKHELKWLERLIQETRPQDTVVDVGAFVGIYTIILAKRIGEAGKVIAFEPNPEALAFLKKNIKLNGVSKQVELFDIAVSDSNKSTLFVKQSSTSHIVSSPALNNPDFVSVKSKSLDDLLQERIIDIIKIDVEGYEINVLYGARKLLARKEGFPRFIFIECHPYMWKELGVNSKDIETLLHDAGYITEVQGLVDDQRLDEINYHVAIFASRHK